MDVVRFIMQKYNARRCAEKTLQEHRHSIQFKEAGQADSAYLLRSQKLELLRTFVEVVSQGNGVIELQYAAVLRPDAKRDGFRRL